MALFVVSLQSSVIGSLMSVAERGVEGSRIRPFAGRRFRGFKRQATPRRLRRVVADG